MQDVSYENVCMRNVQNPIVLTSMYTTFDGNKLPDYRDIVLKNVHSVTPGWLTLLGVDAEHKIGVSLENVTVDGVRQDRYVRRIRVARITRRQSAMEGSRRDRDAGRATGRAAELRRPLRALSADPHRAGKPRSRFREEDKTLYVAASGTGDYYSIQRAIDVAPPEGAVISRHARHVPRSADHQQAEHHHPQQLHRRRPGR